MTTFTVTEDHIKLLREMDFDWDDECEFGAVTSDPKRPFGNSDVSNDITEITGKPDHRSIGEARAFVAQLAAIVNRALADADLNAYVGEQMKLTWRAERLTA